MDSLHRFAVLLVILGLVCTSIRGSTTNDGYEQCERKVRKWASSALDVNIREDKHTLRDLLFFLHIPRTGGRTYYHCFLRKLYSTSQDCPRSYDKLRFDPSKPNCRLLVTHDDYSMMTKLPREKTSVVTILRNPVDRVFSTYEFSIEVAARFLAFPNLTSVTMWGNRLRAKAKGVSTLDIWPWKYLVPFMRNDLFARRDARNLKGQIYVKDHDTYNLEDVAMPLHAFINDPIAQDIVHNGATFQVAGLTNNSYFMESHEVRNCVQKFHSLDDYVLEVAKKRLDDMLYVGLTEEHKESATVFADVVGAQVISQLMASTSHMKNVSNNETDQSSFLDLEADSSHLNGSMDEEASELTSSGTADAANGTMSVGKLMKAYEGCISSLRKTQSLRRISSLKRISPTKFSKEARQQVPQELLQQIISLNSLDMALYKHAQELFAEQHKRTVDVAADMGRQGLIDREVLSFAMFTFLILLLVLIYLNTRRRTSKLKL